MKIDDRDASRTQITKVVAVVRKIYAGQLAD